MPPTQPPTAPELDSISHDPDMITGAEALVLCLQKIMSDHTQKIIFGLPGGAITPVYDALAQQQSIEHILVRHEQSAIHAADSYHRRTSDIGSAIVTSGPGMTNTITGLATAYSDSVGLVLLSGQVPQKLIGTEAFQEVDAIGASRSVTKFNHLLTDPLAIAKIIEEAYHIAQSGRPGPVHIDLPKSTQLAMVPKTIVDQMGRPIEISSTPKVEIQKISEAAESIRKAKKPILYIGGGANDPEIAPMSKTLAAITQAPITQSMMGLGATPQTDPHYIGMLGMHGTQTANHTMHNADLIICLGARFDDRTTNDVHKYCPHAQIIHVNADPSEIDKIIPSDIGIADQLENVLPKLIDELEDFDGTENTADWWKEIETWREEEAKKLKTKETDPSKIDPNKIIQKIYEITEGKATVTTDVGGHQIIAARNYKFDEPNRWITSGGQGTMGFGLPAAIGAQKAHPEETVICVTGDGSIQMLIGELSTAKQEQTPIKIICFNNHTLGMVRQWQNDRYDSRHSGVSYGESLPDFPALARSFGHVGLNATTPEEADDAIETCFSPENKDRLVFLNIEVENTDIYPIQKPGGAMNEMYWSPDEDNIPKKNAQERVFKTPEEGFFEMSIYVKNVPGELENIISFCSQRGYNIASGNITPIPETDESIITLGMASDTKKIKRLQQLMEYHVWNVSRVTVQKTPHS